MIQDSMRDKGIGLCYEFTNPVLSLPPLFPTVYVAVVLFVVVLFVVVLVQVIEEILREQ